MGRLDTSPTIEVVVVGAGIAGSAVALELCERGAAVTVVESERPGAGATGASAGMLAAQCESPARSAKFELGVESRMRYSEFASGLERMTGLDLKLSWCGALVANFSEEEHEAAEATASWQREAGLEAEVLAPSEAAHLQVGVGASAVSYSWFAQDGQIDSQALGGALGVALARAGVRLITGNGASEVVARNGAVTGVAMADGRRLEADRVVLAAGASSGRVGGLPRLLPVRPVRGQILRFAPGAVALERIVASHAGRYLVPRADGSVLAGSTMEEAGFDRSISDAGRSAIHEAVSELFPGLAGRRPAEHWAGLRPLSADSSPVLGPDPDLEGLFYATGYGRDGILIAPLAGRIVADLVLSGRSEYEWQPFRPERFAER